MGVAAVLALGLILIIWGLILVKLTRHPLDPVALFCYLFFFFYLFRDMVITLGLDGPYPDNLWAPAQIDGVLVHGSLLLSGFLVTFVAGYLLSAPVGGTVLRLVPFAWRAPPVHRLWRLTIFLTGAATLITVYLVAHYHGLGGIVRAGKRGKVLAGSFELRLFPATAAVVASALALTLWQRRRRGEEASFVMLAIGVSLLNAVYVYLWGSRQVVVMVLAIFVAGQILSAGPEGGPTSSGAGGRGFRWLRAGLLCLLLVGGLIGLRLVRDNALAGHTTSSIQGQTALRQVSVATNSTYFDASMLAFRDWPSIHPFRNGEDFLRGAEGVVPRALWPGKPAEVVPGEAFRQVYEPTATNGWPLGAVGDWYVNFGILGVLAGGAISGLLYRRIMTVWWEKGPWTPFTMAAVMAVVIFVVPTGFGAATTLDWVVWALPLLLCVRYLCGSRRAAATQIAAVAHR